VYVDDLIICGPNSGKIAEFKGQMMKLFNMSDPGLLSYYLGLEVNQQGSEITISQSAYAKKIVEQCQMRGCNPVDTPMEQRVRSMTAKLGTKKDVTRYMSIIGSLKYLVNTRPDIAYVVGVASRFMEAPDKEHWAVVKRIVRYIAGTIHIWLRYKKGRSSELSLLGYL